MSSRTDVNDKVGATIARVFPVLPVMGAAVARQVPRLRLAVISPAAPQETPHTLTLVTDLSGVCRSPQQSSVCRRVANGVQLLTSR